MNLSAKEFIRHKRNEFIIIECKKETVDARNAKDGIAQLQSYMSVCPNCEWGIPILFFMM